MKLTDLIFLAGATCHPMGLLDENFLEFAKKYQYSEGAGVAEHRAKEFTAAKRSTDGKEYEFPTLDPVDVLRYSTLDHHSNRTDVSADIPLDQLFKNGSSVLQPESTEGPFYVGGELVRDNITESEPGVPLWISANFYDISTNKPVEMYWEIWHCNATGAYSGVDSPMNVHGANLLNETFLRGITKTNSDGAATFKTIFPGHYAGRSVHVHMVAHMDATEYANGTLGIGETSRVAHVGQFFFDDSLNDLVGTVEPYASNRERRTLNKEDLEVSYLSSAGSPDPFFNYVLLGDSVEDGVYAWISIGVDASAEYHPGRAAYRGEDGGVSTGNRYVWRHEKKPQSSSAPASSASSSASSSTRPPWWPSFLTSWLLGA